MSRRAIPAVLGLALLAAACAGGRDRRAVPADEAGHLLIDRNWQDLWPQGKDEQLHVFRFVPSMGGGVYQDRTLFKGEFELFVFKVDGDQLTFVLPHTGEKHTTGFAIERIDGPKPFDLRLTLERSPRGPRIFYGRSSEKIADLGLGPLATE